MLSILISCTLCFLHLHLHAMNFIHTFCKGSARISEQFCLQGRFKGLTSALKELRQFLRSPCSPPLHQLYTRVTTPEKSELLQEWEIRPKIPSSDRPGARAGIGC